jgi:hypothetical protein
MKYILIESMEAFEHTKKIYEDKLSEIMWITTSPFILNYFNENNINFIKIEKYIDHEELNDLQKICSNFQEFFMIFLNKENEWKDYIDFKFIFSSQYHSYLSLLLYKCSILNKIQENFKGEIIVVGDSDEGEQYNFTNILYYSRFQNIYAIIANKYFPNIKIINFVQDKNTMIKKHQEVKISKMKLDEKILSLLNNNLSSFFFKLFLKLSHYNLIKKIRLFYKKKTRQIIICDPTDTIECAFIDLLNKGFEFKIMKKPKIIFKEPSISEMEDLYSRHELYLLENFKSLFSKYDKVKYNNKFEPILNSTIKKIFYKTLRIKKNFTIINKNFEMKYKEFDKNHIFFSNYLFDEVPILYVMFIKKIKKIKIAFFEHGVVQGLQLAQKYRINFNPMHIANIGVYSWEKSLLFEKNFSHQKILISGFSYKQFCNHLTTLKKIFIKRYLKIKNKKKSIIYVADIEKNNFISGPHIGTDLDYYENSKEIVKYLCEKNPNKNIYLKLYPTNRYMQNYDFDDLKKKYDNLYVLRKIDFRFVREIFDEIYLSSYQSTLGWALASQKPVYLVERDVAPINLDGLVDKKINCNVKGIKNIFLLNKNFKKDKFEWVKKLIMNN